MDTNSLLPWQNGIPYEQGKVPSGDCVDDLDAAISEYVTASAELKHLDEMAQEFLSVRRSRVSRHREITPVFYGPLIEWIRRAGAKYSQRALARALRRLDAAELHTWIGSLNRHVQKLREDLADCESSTIGELYELIEIGRLQDEILTCEDERSEKTLEAESIMEDAIPLTERRPRWATWTPLKTDQPPAPKLQQPHPPNPPTLRKRQKTRIKRHRKSPRGRKTTRQSRRVRVPTARRSFLSRSLGRAFAGWRQRLRRHPRLDKPWEQKSPYLTLSLTKPRSES